MRAAGVATRLGDVAGLTGGGAALCALYFLFYGSGAAWFPFFNVYLREIGLTGFQIGLLAGIRPVGMLLSQPVWGIAADVWGRRRTLLLSMLLAATLLLGYSLGRTFQFLLIWTLIYNLLTNPVGALIDSLVLDHLEGREHLSFGRLRVWGAVGWGLTAPLIGYAIAGQDLRLIFVFSAILMGVGWLVAYRSTRRDSSDSSAQRTWSGATRLLRNRRLQIFLLLVTLLQLGASSIFSFYSVYMAELGASSRMIGLAFSLQGLGELPLYLASAAIIGRLGPRVSLVFAFVVYAIRVFAYSVIRQPELAMLIELSHGLSFSLFLVASVEYVNRIVPSEWRATGQSLFWAAYFGLGSILGNLWAGLLYDQWGVQAMFRINGVLILIAALAVALMLGSAGEQNEEPAT